MNRIGPGQLINVEDLWRYPLYTTIALTITTLLAWWMWKKDKLYSQLILSSMTFYSIIASLSLVRVVLLFT
ncbi:hypothetical protein KC571_02230 [candidate division WWE3 bacterium]|uniref:Uncharacterized protein n=1 Tax=candidate division WWE3 bacterium TaxID=2053526 RepID=A0A955LGI8_UNCKA|nr:hypothetical protein [candidate division WWE3 bacterium]